MNRTIGRAESAEATVTFIHPSHPSPAALAILVGCFVLLAVGALPAQIEVEQTTIPVGQCPAQLEALDLDGDGDLDLLFTNHHTHDLRVLTGDGLGSFVAGPVTPVPGYFVSHPESVVTADFDGDGALDAAVIGHANPEFIRFRGDGAGGFIDPVAFPTGNYSVRLDSGDFDENGTIDLVSSNRNDDTMSLHLGTGTGSFASAMAFPVGDGPNFILADDIDGDSHLDVATCDSFGGTVTIYWGLGTGAFDAPTTIGGFPFTPSLCVADLDADGIRDLAVAYHPGVDVLLGLGARTFAPAVTVYPGISTRTVIAADVLGDPSLDLIVADGAGGLIALLPGDGLGGFTVAGTFDVGLVPWGLIAADLDADGRLDIATTNEQGHTLSVLRNLGPSPIFLRGDSNGDDAIDIADPVVLLSRLFTPGTSPTPCADADDANDDGAGDIADPIFVLGVLFSGAGPIPTPTGACGFDPTPDPLGCDVEPACP